MSSPTKHLRNSIQEIKRLYDKLDQVVPWERFVDSDFDTQVVDALQRLIPRLANEHRKTEALLSSRVFVSGRLTGIKPDERTYYEQTIAPRSKLMARLGTWALLAELGDLDPDGQNLKSALAKSTQHSNSRYKDHSILQTFDIGLFRLEDNEEELSHYDWFDELDLEGAREIVDSEFFQPDVWRNNSTKVRPVLLGKHPGISKAHQVRLDDLYRSYLLGQYLSATAMARSVLEYTLSTWASDKKFAIQDLTLEELIDLVTNSIRKLSKEKLEFVRKNGNAIMHPKIVAHDNLIEFPPTSQTCQRCIDILVEAIETLYGSGS